MSRESCQESGSNFGVSNGILLQADMACWNLFSPSKVGAGGLGSSGLLVAADAMAASTRASLMMSTLGLDGSGVILTHATEGMYRHNDAAVSGLQEVVRRRS